MKTEKKEKKQSEFFEFYGGKVILEKKPWGDNFRWTKVQEDGKGTPLLSVTRCTKKLDKSDALIPWAISLVVSTITSHIESAKSDTFTREEIILLVNEAKNKPEDAKVSGGTTGDLIHNFAHDFAISVIEGTTTPSLEHLDPNVEEQAKALNGISAFLEWYNANDVEFLDMEKPYYYNSLLANDSKEGEEVVEYFGLCDLVARVNGKVAVIDYKSSKGIYSEQEYQISAYSNARDKELIALGKTDEVSDIDMVVNFNKITGELMTKEISGEDRTKNAKCFLALYQVAKREKEMEDNWKKK